MNDIYQFIEHINSLYTLNKNLNLINIFEEFKIKEKQYQNELNEFKNKITNLQEIINNLTDEITNKNNIIEQYKNDDKETLVEK